VLVAAALAAGALAAEALVASSTHGWRPAGQKAQLPGRWMLARRDLAFKVPVPGRDRKLWRVHMSGIDYIINGILVLLVLRQIRGSRLDLVNLVLPVVLVGGAAAYYLHSVPTAGNDLVLDLALAGAGAALGFLCALATRVWRGSDGVPMAKAGGIAAFLWVAGIGARMAFAFSTSHGAGPAITRFSIAHSITSSDAWVAALVMMALAEVLTRLGTLRLRGRRLPPANTGASTPAFASALG
jgi:hypothetical protein